MLFRKETCHDCSKRESKPGLFMASIALADILMPGFPYLLFPACDKCFHREKSLLPSSFVPALAPDIVNEKYAYPEMEKAQCKDVRKGEGVMYNKMKEAGAETAATLEIYLRSDLEEVLAESNSGSKQNDNT